MRLLPHQIASLAWSVSLLLITGWDVPVRADDLPPHDVQKFEVQAGDRTLTVEVLSPPADRLAPRPLLVFSLASNRDSGLRVEPYCETARLFLAAGHRAANFSLPCHGERVDAFGEGITGFCGMVRAGKDPFALLIEDGRAALDECIRRKLAEPGRVGVCGTSRGGYCALRWAAADNRIGAVAGLAPVTDWRTLTEFAAVKDEPVVAALALDYFAESLAGRPVFAAIGNADARVGTFNCARFATRLFEEESKRGLAKSQLRMLFVDDSPGHTLSQQWRIAGAQFVLDALQ